MNSSPITTFYLGHFAEGTGEHYLCLAQSELSGTSRINLPESQSHSNKDPQHANTTHENDEENMSNQCGYEQQGKDNASQLNGCNTDYGPHLNPDILENIIKKNSGEISANTTDFASCFHIFQTRCRQLTTSTSLYP